MATLSKLRIELDVSTAGFTAGIRKVEKGLKGMRDRMVAASKASIDLRTALASIAGVGFVAKKLFDLGSAVEETGSKFRTVFGESSKAVQGFIDNFATMAGLSEEAAQGVLATTGAIAQGMGFAQEASAQFATEIVRAAGDLSSFNNIPIAETSLAIQAALTGEREQLKRMGIVVREVDVQLQAFANTGKTVAAELTNQEKATATLQLITERAGFAIGDLVRTQDSAANQARALAAELQNLANEIASALLPAFSTAIPLMRDFIRGLQLMGVEAVVTTAGFKVLALEGAQLLAGRLLDLGDKIASARAMVDQFVVGMDEMRLEIVGVEFATQGAASGIDDLTTSLTAADVAARAAGKSLEGLKLEDGALLKGATALKFQFEKLEDSLKVLGVGTGIKNFKQGLDSAKRSAKELAITTEDFTNGFANAMINATATGIEAFRNFAAQAIREILRIQLVASLTSIFGGGGGVGGKAASAASVGATTAGVFNPGAVGGQAASGLTASSFGSPIVNQTINFVVPSIDQRGVQGFFRENAGEIVNIVGKGARQSSAFRSQLRGAI